MPAVAGHSCQTSLPLSLPTDGFHTDTLIIKESKSISKEVSPYCYINAHWSLGGCEHWISSVSLKTDIKYLGCWERGNHIQYREKERSDFEALLSNIVWFYSPNVRFSCYFSCKNQLFLRHLFSGVKKETRVDYVTEWKTVLVTSYSFYQAKMPNVFWFQHPKYEGFQIFFDLHCDCKPNTFQVLNITVCFFNILLGWIMGLLTEKWINTLTDWENKSVKMKNNQLLTFLDWC